jgi:uncharacterized protein YpiB (UPF0302 family)
MQPGDWVIVVNKSSTLYLWIGFVEWIRPPECKVQFTLDPHGRPTGEAYRILMRDLEVIEKWEPTDDAIDTMIDLALDTRDEEWFRELIAQKGGERVDTV